VALEAVSRVKPRGARLVLHLRRGVRLMRTSPADASTKTA
jgi:hypothetical protein